jgi:hypothetical protein
MRDGLHKDLPLGRAWQGVLKACEREAERAETAREQATNALARDVKREVSKTFVRQLVQTADDGASLLPSFNAFGEKTTSREMQGSNSPLENDIVANAKRLESDGLRGRPLARRAVEEALKERGESRGRQIEQTCHTAGEDAGAISRAARDAIRGVDLSTIVEPLLRNEPTRCSAKRRHVDVDEDLTNPK